MPQLSAARSVAILRDARVREAVRYVDMGISLRVCDLDTSVQPARYREETDEQLVELGGRWDRRRKCWAGDAAAIRIVRVPRGSDQEQPARWLAEWLQRYARGAQGDHWREPRDIPGRISVAFRRVWTLLLVGGRRGGKTYLAIVALCAVALLAPGSILWAVSPTREETDELEREARAQLPTTWYREARDRSGDGIIFKFVNGSRMMFLSGHKPHRLKRGRVDVALYNEGQNMARTGWRQLRGAIADRGGLVIVAANPPDNPIGRWVDDVYQQARAGAIEAVSFHHRGSNNPFVTAQALEDMRREVDTKTAAREIDGEMGVPIGDTVFHAWSDAETIRSEVPPNLIDVTAEVTKRELGRAFGYVVGMDFQKTPHMVAVVYKFFQDPSDPDQVQAWGVDEVYADNSNEEELLDGLEALDRWTRNGRVPEQGYRGWFDPSDSASAPVTCCIVADASGFFQDGEHQKGAQSDRRMAARRWTFAYRPQKDSDRNPAVAERVKITNARLKTADSKAADGTLIPGRRRMFFLAHVIRTCKSMRDWENNKTTGAPSRTSDKAHGCDAATYPIFRFFGKAKQPARTLPQVEVVPRARDDSMLAMERERRDEREEASFLRPPTGAE